MTTLKIRWRGQIWLIQKWFPKFWVVHVILRDDYHSTLGHNCTHPSDLSDALKTEGNKNTTHYHRRIHITKHQFGVVNNVYKMLNNMP